MSRKRTLLKMLIGVLCCAAFCITALAVTCTLHVTVRQDDQPIPEFRVAACQVATLQDGVFAYTEDFSALSIPVEELAEQLTPEQAEQVYAFAQEKQAVPMEQLTDETGKADFTQLTEGLYLVYAPGGQIAKFSPYLVRMPGRINSEIVYDIYSSPKSVTANVRDLLVVVQWVDQENAAGLRPESVQITLYQDEAVTQRTARAAVPIRQVSVNEACQWQHLFENLPLDGVYSVEQNAVPEYTTTIEETDYGFLITNVYTPPQKPDDPDLPPIQPDMPSQPPKPDVPQKPEIPEEPSVPQEPVVPDEPGIPQAGFRMWPVYVMLALGLVLVVFGLTDLYLGREVVCEDEWEEEWEEEQEISS